ncbi:hypothetical protein [Pseudalkalibacillus caeni]|uniref:hypothetical protein n=1 Tax=Exobacillus caeni TaxID=2574798 RepID=UPI001485526A|nr:hypothetical protein [Pseudalkalibacillus caeni]
MIDLASVWTMTIDWFAANRGYKSQGILFFSLFGTAFVTYFIWFMKKGFDPEVDR